MILDECDTRHTCVWKNFHCFLDNNYTDTTCNKGKTEQRRLVKVIWHYRSILQEQFNATHKGIGVSYMEQALYVKTCILPKNNFRFYNQKPIHWHLGPKGFNVNRWCFATLLVIKHSIFTAFLVITTCLKCCHQFNTQLPVNYGNKYNKLHFIMFSLSKDQHAHRHTITSI